jgi:hypothetical protein
MTTFARRLAINALAGAVILGGCDDDDDGVAPPVEAPAPEATTFEVTIENVSTSYDFLGSGVFAIPEGQDAPGPLHAGQDYHFDFAAAPGMYLSFATMFVHSNDYFYAPAGRGIPLYEADGTPVEGDVTDQVMLWDAGTEANQEPGSGADQAPRQTGLDTGGVDPDNTVRLVTDVFGNLPEVADVIRVTLEAQGGGLFHLHIGNVSNETTLTTTDMTALPDVPLAPGVWVVHSERDPLFTEGEADRGQGLEGLAEDGTAGELAAALSARTGLTSPIAPGVFAVHTTPGVLFDDGASASDGMEALAEDGEPQALADELATLEGVASGAFATPVGAETPAPAFPGESYTFTFEAIPGDYLSFATMLVQSNDLFYAPGERGVGLFGVGDQPISGNITDEVQLWDAGTEVNEAPGAGPNQAPRQAGPDTGHAEDGGTVHEVDVMMSADGFHYPDIAEVIRVTIRALSN